MSELVWVKVGNGEYEVATWWDEDAQKRAETIFKGWKLLGCPKSAESVRPLERSFAQ